ncbi:MAG: serine/threonine-protein kinase, partial [Polyangiales bacterium]
DLHRVLQQRGPLPVSEAVDYILQAADGLAEAHAKGIVHRDLKPSNLVLTRRADGEALVKVLDFGISKLAPLEGEGELTETQSLLGSPAYMAPEQVRSARKVDSRADVWGLGIVLYRLLTRKNPFSGEGVIELCSAILTQAPVKPTEVRPELPKDLEAVILKCLEKEPAARYQSVQELARALAPFAPESSMSMRFLSARLQPIAAVESVAKQDVTHDAVQLPARPTQKSRVLLALAVTALTTFAVLGFFLTRHPMQPIEPPPREAELAKHAESAKVVPVESASQTAAPSPSPSTSASAAQSATTKAPKVGKPSVKSATSPSWGKLIDDPL